jgi:hypothetical protein
MEYARNLTLKITRDQVRKGYPLVKGSKYFLDPQPENINYRF